MLAIFLCCFSHSRARLFRWTRWPLVQDSRPRHCQLYQVVVEWKWMYCGNEISFHTIGRARIWVWLWELCSIQPNGIWTHGLVPWVGHLRLHKWYSRVWCWMGLQYQSIQDYHCYRCKFYFNLHFILKILCLTDLISRPNLRPVKINGPLCNGFSLVCILINQH